VREERKWHLLLRAPQVEPLYLNKKKNGIECSGVYGLASCFFSKFENKKLVFFFLRNSHAQTICTPYAGAEEEEGQEDLQF
jgi:hypothetical protein